MTMVDAVGPTSPNRGAAVPNPARKRKRKSRKVLEKKFTCFIEDCGKVYSRAEHLQRHQLNHNSSQTFRCEYPDCSRTFVRPDLLKRHLDRHVAKGVHPLSDRHATAAQSPSPHHITSSLVSPTSPEVGMYQQRADFQPQLAVRDSMYARDDIGNNYFRSMATTTYTSNDDSRLPPESLATHNQPQILPGYPGYQLSALKFSRPGIQAEIPTVTDHTNMLNQMSTGDAGPVFGVNSGLHKSPCGGIPADFMAYLFDSVSDVSLIGTHVLPPTAVNYGDLNQSQYSINDAQLGIQDRVYQPLVPQQIMSVYNLLEPNMPEASMSDSRSQDIFDYIKNRFHGNEKSELQKTRDSIIAGDRSQNDHILSKRMMQAYIGSFWRHFNAQLPILHKPTFSADRTPKILLLAIMAIGAACLDKKRETDVTMAGVHLSNFLVTQLRWEVFMNPGFRPPAKLWVFQTLLLLELYEKMCATRELHERAHIHHATTITLMRRGRSLIGKSSLEPSHAGESSQTQTNDDHWKEWIINESTRRVACAAFMIDSIHATMFGHSAIMAAHELRLPLPCDDGLWMATSSAELSRMEGNLAAQGLKPISFLEGLKKTLNKQQVHTNLFGRASLMAGLLNVTYHLNQRDLQANVLGSGMTPQVRGGQEKWRIALTRAYDFWKTDFDKSLQRKKPCWDPYGNDDASTEMCAMFESRVVLHHLAHMAMHADIVDCQIFARATRLLGRPVGANEFSAAQRRIKEDWAPSNKGRDAVFYALKFLRIVLAPDQIERRESVSVSSQQAQPYWVRNDILLNRPWVLYFAALVVWCYGYATEGPCVIYIEPTTSYEQRWSLMRDYLAIYADMKEPRDLQHMRGVSSNVALLTVLRDSLGESQWELLREAGKLLQNCITLSQGEFVL